MPTRIRTFTRDEGEDAYRYAGTFFLEQVNITDPALIEELGLSVGDIVYLNDWFFRLDAVGEGMVGSPIWTNLHAMREEVQGLYAKAVEAETAIEGPWN